MTLANGKMASESWDVQSRMGTNGLMTIVAIGDICTAFGATLPSIQI